MTVNNVTSAIAIAAGGDHTCSLLTGGKIAAARQIVFAKGYAASGTHTVVIKVLGTHAPGATGNRVDLDAFLVLGP